MPTPKDLGREPIVFERKFHLLGLLTQTDFGPVVHCILKDQNLTDHERDNIISITGSELFLIHAVETWKEVEEVRRRHSRQESNEILGIDFKKIRPPKAVNTPIKVSFTENVETSRSFEGKTFLWVSANNLNLNIPNYIPYGDQVKIARAANADSLYSIYEVQFGLTNLASQYRSVPRGSKG